MYNAGEPTQSYREHQIEEIMAELNCTYKEAVDIFEATEQDEPS